MCNSILNHLNGIFITVNKCTTDSIEQDVSCTNIDIKKKAIQEP